jgi:uncharacterized membrane protein
MSKENADRAQTAAHDGDRPIRSLTKAVSWRVTGSIDTMLLSWFFTGDLRIAAAIGLTEVVTKMVLYYLHERAWNRIALGRGSDQMVAGVTPARLPATLESVSKTA